MSLSGPNFKAEAFAFNPSEVTKSRLEAIHWVGLTSRNDADALHGRGTPGNNSTRTTARKITNSTLYGAPTATGRLVALHDILHRQTTLVANGAKRKSTAAVYYGERRS